METQTPPAHGSAPRSLSRLGAVVGAVLLALALAPTGAIARNAPQRLRLGTRTLTRCGEAPLSYCGRLAVPLDHNLQDGPQITLAFRWYPARDAALPARGTVVPVEGGPGYPSSASVSQGYDVMYGTLLNRWNLLVVDNRGTGGSTALSCPALQGFSGSTAGDGYQRAVATCARALDHRWRYHGRWMHASDLFGSAAAAQDLAELIGALRLPRIDLYGDSYGSYFAQIFAAGFPRLVRSVVLDSTYQLVGLDPWYRSTIAAMPAAFDAVCSRWQPCASAAPGSSWSRLTRLATTLRAHPIAGYVPDARGSVRRVRITATGLADLLSDAAGDPEIYRAMDAATRSLLDGGDGAPLLRLYAQRLAADEDYSGQPARQYSDELYLAVSCTDYPQLFDMTASPGQRILELARAESSLGSLAFSPFTVGEWLDQDQYTEAYTACLNWPAPAGLRLPVSVAPPTAARTPVLVLAGELDTWTPPSGAAVVRAQLGARSRMIVLANSTHVVGEGNPGCASEVIREFVARPAGIASLNASCAATVPPIHAVGVYPARLSQQPPLTPTSRVRGDGRQLRLAAAAVATAGDAIARAQATDLGVDHGLHGGTVRAAPDGNVLVLRGDRLIPGVPVTGRVVLRRAADPSNGQRASATLRVSARGMPSLRLRASWTTAGRDAKAHVTGAFGSGTMPAP